MSSARPEVFAEVCAVLVNDALGLGLTALVVVGGVVEAAIETGVERAIALGAFVAKADALLDRNFPRTVRAVHNPKRSRDGAVAALTIALRMRLLA